MKHAPTQQDTTAKERLQREQERLRQYLTDLRATFGTEHGQRVLATLRAAAGCDKPRYRFPADGRHTSPVAAAFHDGRASLILEITDHLATAEDVPQERPGVRK